MDNHRDGDRLSFLGRRLPASFEIRLVAVAPGCDRAFDRAEWQDALVVVERGEIELECERGTHRRFARGAVLCFARLPLRTLRNPGAEPALLAAVSRRPQPAISTDESAPRSAS
jgi:quercetin dioxygenase-like cupin family protein